MDSESAATSVDSSPGSPNEAGASVAASSAAQGHSEQPPGPGWPPVMTDEEAKAKLREKVAARRERDAAITYRCQHCGKPVKVPHAAAWPSQCQHCKTAPPTLIVRVPS